ncbi:efflux transporter outer membrane subunit [Asticcacaulis sp. EMRT-3]|uniref:efflux transporter outer membrane subunit n=1 Tax=Asticcacaulis sp. EMRT-3 TaxID=3040349 RepID=UPI0024AE8F4F|nr:efflux transporter outer membrane subunit [Asticcacaulis sp. EMRT-3]MDI7775949.1 efflux transporter outer membrane subunit [Asticcacaulis sp. EMRT-3]
MTLFKTLPAVSLAAALLSGCASAPLPPPSFATPAAFATASEASSTPAPQTGGWWLIFSDPVLDDLMARASQQNNDIRLSAAHLEQARALLKSSHADLWPQAGVSYNPSQSTYLQPQGKAATSHALDLNLSYEVDLSGRLAKAASAAHLDAEAAQSLLDETQLLIQSQVAQSYFALRALDEDRAIVADTLTAYRGSLDVTQKRFKEGDIAELDVARMQTEVASTEAEGAALDQQRAELAHALAILVGEPASTFDVTTSRWASQPWAGSVPAIPAGIPADVLARRPDVKAAQASLFAAQKRVGIAKAAWLPSLSLTASGGYLSPDLDTLVKSTSTSWSLAAMLSQAVFDGGQRRARIDYAQGGLDAAFATYQQQVLTALGDVEDQLSDLGYLRQQQTAQDAGLEAANRALAMSQSRYANGSSSQLDVLDAERQQLAVRRQALRVRAARYESTVGLIRALGGAW